MYVRQLRRANWRMCIRIYINIRKSRVFKQRVWFMCMQPFKYVFKKQVNYILHSYLHLYIRRNNDFVLNQGSILHLIPFTLLWRKKMVYKIFRKRLVHVKTWAKWQDILEHGFEPALIFSDFLQIYDILKAIFLQYPWNKWMYDTFW